MRKKGFTLAEILITLGIIGVVAALTTPGLIMRSTQNANAARLAATVADIQNALTNAIANAGVDGLDELDEWTDGANSVNAENTMRFVGNIGRFLHITGVATKKENNTTSTLTAAEYYGSLDNIHKIDTNDKTTDETTNLFGNAAPILTKKGATLFIHKDYVLGGETELRKAGGSLINKAANVVIDVNGVEAPNQCGRDIFGFYLSNDGILYPLGGHDALVWDGDENEYSDGLDRTARLIQNGYKFNY